MFIQFFWIKYVWWLKEKLDYCHSFDCNIMKFNKIRIHFYVSFYFISVFSLLDLLAKFVIDVAVYMKHRIAIIYFFALSGDQTKYSSTLMNENINYLWDFVVP